jgi:Rrf2 family protein
MSRSTNTQFAVAAHVLTYLAGIDDGRAVSSDELSRSANVNPVYVRRVLSPLRAAGLVRSRPGVRGGWELALEPSRISLAQVWLLLQGAEPVLGLHGPDPECVTGRSVQTSLIALDREVAGAIADSLREVTVEHLLADVLSSTAPSSGAEAVDPR